MAALTSDDGVTGIGLGYPGGPQLARLAESGRPGRFRLPRPMLRSGDLDFSFSGVKTAALRYLQQEQIARLTLATAAEPEKIPQVVLDLVSSYQKSIIDQLLNRLDRALEGREVRAIHISGGVACVAGVAILALAVPAFRRYHAGEPA